MAGIRASARIITVKAQCGHSVMVSLPPGEIGKVGQRRMAAAAGSQCRKCQEADDHFCKERDC
jgi:hypothetical protein